MAFLRNKIANPGGKPFCLIVCLINQHWIDAPFVEKGFYRLIWSEREESPIPEPVIS